MHHTLKLVSLILILFSSATYAQDESWDVYMAQYEKGPGSTVLNMSLVKAAPNPGFPFILIVEVRFKDCDKEGLPSKKQFPVLYAISDSIKSIVDKKIKNILAGTFTYQCERTDYYYVPDTSSIRASLKKPGSEIFKDLDLSIRIKEDKAWDGYLKFLYPNEETREFMDDSKVVMALANKGDKLEKARKVDHWIYFSTEQDRNCFIDYIKIMKFTIEAKTKIDNKKNPYSLQISRNDKVSLPEISTITKDLRLHAKKCNGDYDGWETFLVTDQPDK